MLSSFAKMIVLLAFVLSTMEIGDNIVAKAVGWRGHSATRQQPQANSNTAGAYKLLERRYRWHPDNDQYCGYDRANPLKHGRECFSRLTLGETLGRMGQTGAERNRMKSPTHGQRSTRPDNSRNRIYGSQSHWPRPWPWFVSDSPWTAYIRVNIEKMCGNEHWALYPHAWCTGVVINNRWIMTAGHCLYNQSYSEMEAFVGILDRKRLNMRVKILARIVHECYFWPGCPYKPLGYLPPEPHCPKLWLANNNTFPQFDIGLLYVEDLAPEGWPQDRSKPYYSPYYTVNAICMCAENHTDECAQRKKLGSTGPYLFGLGLVGEKEQDDWLETPTQTGSEHLHYKAMQRLDDTFLPGYNQTVFQFESEVGFASCAGDSGGPVIQTNDGELHWYLIGILSTGDHEQEIGPKRPDDPPAARVFPCANTTSFVTNIYHERIFDWINWALTRPNSSTPDQWPDAVDVIL